MMAEMYRKNTTGMEFEISLKDDDSDASSIPLGDTANETLVFTKPDGTQVEPTAEEMEDLTTNPNIIHVKITNDKLFDQVGAWHVRARWTENGGVEKHETYNSILFWVV